MKAEGPVPQKAVNRPTDGASASASLSKTGGTPFRNLEADPVTVTVNMDGKYTEIFTGETYSKGKHDFVLAPGEYIVLTK